MSALANEYGDNAAVAPILKQAAREALLLMASDWQFVISTGGAKDYGTVRLRNHYDNFQALAGLIRRAGGRAGAVGRRLEEHRRVRGPRQRLPGRGTEILRTGGTPGGGVNDLTYLLAIVGKRTPTRRLRRLHS